MYLAILKCKGNEDKEMQKYEIIPDSKHLLCIFAKDSAVNSFRFQDCISLYVSYSEYVQFVKFCLKANLQVLHFKSDVYVNALPKEQILKRLYLLDLADVVLFEVFLSYQLQKPCTNIRHSFDNNITSIITMSEFIDLFNEVDDSCRQKGLSLLQKKIPIDFDENQLVGNAKVNYYYGVTLLALSFKTDLKEFNIGG
mgnify:FL=1